MRISARQAVEMAMTDMPEVDAAKTLLAQRLQMIKRFGFLREVDPQTRELIGGKIGQHLHDQRPGLVEPAYWFALLLEVIEEDSQAKSAATQPVMQPAMQQPADQPADGLEKPAATAQPAAAVSEDAISAPQGEMLLHEPDFDERVERLGQAIQEAAQGINLNVLGQRIGEHRNTLRRIVNKEVESRGMKARKMLARVEAKLLRAPEPAPATARIREVDVAQEMRGLPLPEMPSGFRWSSDADTQYLQRLAVVAQHAVSKQAIKTAAQQASGITAHQSTALVAGSDFSSPPTPSQMLQLKAELEKMAAEGFNARERARQVWQKLTALGGGALNQVEMAALLTKHSGQRIDAPRLNRVRNASGTPTAVLDAIDQAMAKITPEEFREAEQRSLERVKDTRKANHLTEKHARSLSGALSTMPEEQFRALEQKLKARHIELPGLRELRAGRIHDTSGPEPRLLCTPAQGRAVREIIHAMNKGQASDRQLGELAGAIEAERTRKLERQEQR